MRLFRVLWQPYTHFKKTSKSKQTLPSLKNNDKSSKNSNKNNHDQTIYHWGDNDINDPEQYLDKFTPDIFHCNFCNKSEWGLDFFFMDFFSKSV